MTRKSFAKRFGKGVAIISLAALPFLAVGYQLHDYFWRISRLDDRSGNIEERLGEVERKLDTLPAALGQLSENDQELLKGTNRGFLAVEERINGIDPIDGEYDFDNDLVDHKQEGLDMIAASQYLIRTNTSIGLPGIDGEGMTMERQIEGCCTVIAGNYVITVNHVVDNIRSLNTGMEVLSDKSYLISKDGKEIELETVIRDYKNDLAVFRLPVDMKAYSFPFKLGKSSDLKLGNLVYLVGNLDKS